MKRPTIQRSSLVLWGLIALLLVFVVLSLVLRRAETPVDTPPERARAVFTQHVVTQPVEDVIRLPGRLEPYVRARLAVDKAGRVTDIFADRGDTVRRDQVLLRIDDRVWRALLDHAEIEAREAEKDYARWTELARTGAVSDSEYDVVRARRDRARVQLEEARVHVAQCEVRSPFDGVINERHVELGEFAHEGGTVFELVVSDPVKLALDIPERDIAAVEVGDEMAFRVSVLGDAEFVGSVAHVAEAASPANNSYRVEAVVPNADRTLRPGMIATARLVRARRDEAVVVPLSSVIPRKGDHIVFVVRNDRAVRRLVKLDRIFGADVILASGLEPGEELIVDGHRDLVDGALIERVND